MVNNRQPLDVFGQNCDIMTAIFQEISSGSRMSDSGIKAEQSYVHVQSSSGTNATFCPSRCSIKEVPAASSEVAAAPGRG